MFSEFLNEITKELEAKESRNRARGANAQISFSYAVGYILKELFGGMLCRIPRGKAQSIYAAVITLS